MTMGPPLQIYQNLHAAGSPSIGSESELGLVLEVLVGAEPKEVLEGLADIGRCVCARLEVLVASFVAPSLHIARVDLAPGHIDFVAAHNDLDSVRFNAVAAHFFLPVDEGRETVLVVHVVDHDDSVCVLVELLPNQPVVIVPRQIEEVYRDGLVFDRELFDAVVNSNRRNVALYEASFAVALDKAALANFLVSNRGYLEANLIRRRHVSKVTRGRFRCSLWPS